MMDEDNDKNKAPSTVLSDDDLEARIASLGLSVNGGVEDRSTGESSRVMHASLQKQSTLKA